MTRPSESSDDSYRLARVQQLQAVVERRLMEHMCAAHADYPGGPIDLEEQQDCTTCAKLAGTAGGIIAALTIILWQDWGGIRHAP